jgi:gliding motility-associated-like protein
MKRIFLLLLVLVNCIVHAQLVINNTSQTPQQLIQSVVVGQGINVSNITYNGTAANADMVSDQVGQFSNGLTTNIGLDSGIILSTGNAIIAKGPNDTNLGTLPPSNPFTGDADLYILSNNQSIQNVAILEFDFIPTGNKLSFNFVFASEEYPEFVNDTYNDNFGFFLSGPGITGPFSRSAKNIALIPTTTLPVSINNLNNGNSNLGPCEYCQYYVNNEGGTSIQYDGFTTVLAAKADIICGETYHIKLAIANVGDNNYDSAVFIEGASFSSPGINLGSDVTVCTESTYILNSGLSTSEIHEWRYNGDIVTGKVGPEITVNQSGLYSVQAFPYGTTCPVNDEIEVSFTTAKSLAISCDTKTATSQKFDWDLLTNVTSYSVSYQVESNPTVTVGDIGNTNFYIVSNLNSGESVVITVTPNGLPASCYLPASQSCSLTACSTPTVVLTQGTTSQTVCASSPISKIIYTIGGGATSASITTGSLPDGITANLIGNQLNIEGIPAIFGTFNYSVGTTGGCSPNATLNGSITVNQKETPTFTAIESICEGETLDPLPLQSNNGINGTWSPALNNTATTEYTFTSDSGQCANTTTLTITVNQKETPTFTAIESICEGETLAPLPLQSNNGINGTWPPALNNTATTEYTFTPDSGQCANTTTLTITVNQKETPTFTAIESICEGETLDTLLLQSNNGINGTWSPALNNTTTTEYTFTPDSGQCANTTTLTITVDQKEMPTFTAISAVCEGETLGPLPLQSNNSINGTWTPALNNTATTEYTFTPDSGQCANTTTLTITVNQKETPTFTAISAVCEGETLDPLPLQSNNSINGTWTPALNNTATTEYTFTPDSDQCANSSTLSITIFSNPIPLIVDGKICVDKNSNALIQSYFLDTKLNNVIHDFNWYLEGNKIINATENTFEATEKGTYSVRATNRTTNCTSSLIEAIVTETLANSASFVISQSNAFSEEATLTVSTLEGFGNFEYQLDNMPFQLSNVFSQVTSGTHVLRVVEINGCTNLTYQVIVIGYPKYFTPNGDGYNDKWNIIGINNQYNPLIYIFDRFGKLLKQLNTTDFGWDGTFNNYPMPATDYWFKVVYLEDGISKEFKSHFTLKR